LALGILKSLEFTDSPNRILTSIGLCLLDATLTLMVSLASLFPAILSFFLCLSAFGFFPTSLPHCLFVLSLLARGFKASSFLRLFTSSSRLSELPASVRWDSSTLHHRYCVTLRREVATYFIAN